VKIRSIRPAIVFALVGYVLVMPVLSAQAIPPDYSTFNRQQKEQYRPDPNRLLRIWTMFIGQGDGMLIQLPTENNYDPDIHDSEDAKSERVDILIDGGAFYDKNAKLMLAYLKSLYGNDAMTIEHAVITHHDSDHIKGLMTVLADDKVAVENVYHNGLASYKRGKRGFPETGIPKSSEAVTKGANGRISRGMAFLEDGGKRLKRDYLITDLEKLRGRLADDEFHGVYLDLADQIVKKWRDRGPLTLFRPIGRGDGDFIAKQEDVSGRKKPRNVSFDVLWPLDPPRRYGNWGQTINGNSVTFTLQYGDFEMLFTGDHNEKSEKAVLNTLTAEGKAINCDVMKVPHHGSKHALKEFFTGHGPGCRPVVSVASMGEKGAESKSLSGGSNWQHPSTEVIRWLGGAHRVYHTLLHERKFDWKELSTKAAHERLYERSHVLIETDGKWFRVVEVPIDHADFNDPPSVRKTRRGNGTRWIKATP